MAPAGTERTPTTAAFHASTGWSAARAAASEGGSARVDEPPGELKGGSKRRDEAVEREAGTQHGPHAVAGGQLGDGGGLAGEQRGRGADVEPFGKKAGCRDAAHGFVKASELRLRHLAVGFVGGEEMGHDAFKPERRTGAEAGEDAGEIAEACALAAHAGVDLKMDGHGACLRSGGARGG